MKKVIFFTGFLVLFLTFIIILIKPKNYTTNYKIKNFNIKEEYDKKASTYSFYIDDGIVFNYKVKHNYVHKRALISKIKFIENNKTFCISFTLFENQITPICHNGKEYVSYHLINDEKINNYFNIKLENKVVDKKYKKINIYNDKVVVAVWNYKGFDVIKGNKYKTVSILSKDAYDTSLIYKIDNLIMIPDYDNSFYFNKLYIFNINTLDVKTWNIEYNIYFDSYILGDYNKEIYLVDRKEQREYSINLTDKKISVVNEPFIINNSKESISINKLINNYYKFNKKNVLNYVLDNDKLYYYYNVNYKVLCSDLKNIDIIDVIEGNVYYLLDYELYRFNIINGEQKLLSKAEWTFNSLNKIFMFN